MASSPDAIVIGGGIIGASIAWKLARAGLRVILADAGSVGGEASWAGAGMLAPGGEVVSREAWLDLALESMRLYPEFVEELQSNTGVRIDYRLCGGVEVAFDAEEWQALASRAERQRAMDIASSVIDRHALRELVPLCDREYAGAIFYPDDALVDPRDIMRALKVACRAARVEIREGWRATSVHVSHGLVLVESDAGRLHAPVAVLAAGAWATSIAISGASLPALPAAFPVKGMLTSYQLEPGVLGPLLRRGHTYVLQRSTGILIGGTTSEQVGFNRRIDQHSVDDITARVGELLPSIRRYQPMGAWVGFRPAADSAGPLIQRAGDTGLWLAYGHYRNGILLAPVTAQRVSEGITRNAEGAGAVSR